MTKTAALPAAASTDERPLHVHEFAEKSGVSVPHIYNCINRGEIPVIKLGKRKLIPGPWAARKLRGDAA